MAETKERKCKELSNFTIRKDGTCRRYALCRGQERKGCKAKGQTR